MDKTEIAIAGISEAETIKYYFMPDGVMGLLLIKDSEVFNLSAGESHFDSLEQAAVRAFAACSDAAADDMTREILSERAGAVISPILRQIEGADGAYEKTMPFEKDTVSAFQWMMEYYLEMIYEKLGCNAVFPAELKGYRRRYSLSFRLNGERKAIPFSYTERGGCFDFVFGNIIGATDSIMLSVRYSFGIISVNIRVKCKKQMRIENTFDILRKSEKLRIFDDSEIIYDGCRDIASVKGDIPEKIKKICICCGHDIIKLPFGYALISASDNKTEIIAAQNNFNGTAAFLFQAEREFTASENKIVTDSMAAVHEFFQSDGKMNICSRFLPTGTFSKGMYRQKLENRYFYRCFDDLGGEDIGC
ncbi:MAG: hypothetical protein MSJ26_04490 [Oscillospiraceae bacterium]|nr:hypothetical protein [Oscillospiraceae bacterium]